MLCGDTCLQVELFPEFDQFGAQIETVMAYKEPGQPDSQARISFALYDTGASVITISAMDQLLYELSEMPIGVKVSGGAVADAIGGTLVGDVSMPGEIIVDGLHSVNLGGDFEMEILFNEATARTPGVQAFLGTSSGSELLPTITGTVIHNPSPSHPNGTAAWIDMTAYRLDFGELFPELLEFQGIVIDMPDLRFVEPGTKLTAPTDGSVTEPVRIPLELWGDNNYANPGDLITTSPNPVQPHTSFVMGGTTVSDRTMLFDTGAQLSVISTEIALQLGLDLDNPETSITVQGAAGTVDVPGYTIDALELPRDDNGDGIIDGTLQFSNVPIYVLDVVPGLDGILGMNLFNLAHGMLYDPFDPAGASLQVSFFKDLVRELPLPEEELAIDMLSGVFPALGSGHTLPSFGLEVPEVNHAPTKVELSRTEVFAGTEGAWVGAINVVDPDAGDTHVCTVDDPRFEVRGDQLYLKAGESLNVAPGSTIPVAITATDSATPGLSRTEQFLIEVEELPDNWNQPYQWKPTPQDVDLDGIITPLDALLIINKLNAEGAHELPEGTPGAVDGPFWDVSGDGELTPLDALLVINYLNGLGGA